MPQNRLDKNLGQTLRSNRKCLMPYVTAGFPNLDVTAGLLDRFDAIGCPAIEIGFPFSDSIADGPVIQDSFNRALDANFKIEALFECVRQARSTINTALVAMVSMSIVSRCGVEEFMQRARTSGFDGVIVPDVPVNESRTICDACESKGLRMISMVAPTSSVRRQEQIAKQAQGFVYVIAAKGITGERRSVDNQLPAMIERLRQWTDVPLVAGFGIATTDQVRDVCRVADGAIVGSAVIRRISEAVDRGDANDQIVEHVTKYVEDLYTGTLSVTS